MRRLCNELHTCVDQEIEVAGWVHRVRELGQVCFVILRDRTGLMQIVLDKKPDFPLESVIQVNGKVIPNEKAPGGYEIQAQDLQVLATADPNLPIQVNQDPSNLSLEAILDHRTLSLRNPKIQAIFKIQAAIIKYFADFLVQEGFTEIKTSKLIGTGTEGGTGLFEVNYFDTKVFLAQSPQFYKQAMVASGLERVFEIGNAYRAEKHETPRHLNEYCSLDIEMAFIQSEQDLMDLEIRILAAIFEGILSNHQQELEMWDATVPTPDQIRKSPRIPHEEAKDIINQMGDKKVYEITPEGEKLLCQWAEKEHGIAAVFVNEFPRKKRPFYTFPSENNKTLSFDFLFRGLEITTGGKRINEYPMLVDSMQKFKLDPEAMRDYGAIFKYGCPPHGGFAIGLERLTQQILGLANVKEATLFPRDRKRIRP